ncbi:unnamed protein product [Ilex paraguariensis]|uniref:COP1-interacting protein 7 n=1 Tax=Ilex paraguariensis TaxID=185542 RepID=A0ABC8TFI6_9AQUA
MPVGQQEYFHGQFPHPMFPPWPIHPPPGALPVFQAYPMQGMPYYQNYSGNGPFYQPHYPPMGDSHLNANHRTGQKRQSMDGRDSNTESEAWEMDASKTRSQDDLELEKEASQSQESRKKAGRSGKKQSGMVVIRNINYITKNAKNSACSESDSASDSETDVYGEGLPADDPDMMHKNTLRSSRRKGSHAKSTDESNLYDKEEITYEKETDGGHWQAFQTCLLRGADEDNHAAKEGMFAMEKDVQMKRRQNKMGDDLLALGGRVPVKIQDRRMTDFHRDSGNGSRKLRLSNDEIPISGYEDHRGPVDDQMDIHFTEIDGRKVMYRRKANDDFMMNGRENQSGLGRSSDPLTVNGFDPATGNLDRKSSHDITDESFIVPFRSMPLDQAGTDDRTAIDMDSELPSTHQKSENNLNGIESQTNYEPDDLSLMPERGTEKRSIGYDPSLDYAMQVCDDAASLEKRNKEVVTDVKQSSNKGKERKSKVTPDNLEKKTGGPIRKGKPSKISPLDDARARAEKLRAYKSDLQKMKKEKEEEDLKRIEALKMERQKRIAARGSSTSAQSQLPSLQSRKLPTKLSTVNHKGSKFSDSEPGSSSPLQRSKIKTASIGSNDFHKASKASRSSDGSHLAGNKLSRSASSLSEPKKESSGATPDSKASMVRIRRLSEPKTIGSHIATSVKVRSSNQITKPKVSDGPESKKISAIMNLDRSKAATLPELKIRTSKGPSNVVQNKSAAKVNGGMASVTSDSAERNKNNNKVSHQSDVDDNPIIEKTVVMLECEKPSILAAQALEEKMGSLEGHYDNHDMGEKIEVAPEYAAIRAPPLPMDGGGREFKPSQLQGEASSCEVTTNYAEKELPKLTSITTAEKSYQAPYARVSSLEDPCTGHSEYGKAPPASSAMVSTDVDTVKTHVSNVQSLKVEMIPEDMEKPRVKESSKGFRRLLKFGKKNHTSTAGDRSVESDIASVNGSEQDDAATNAAASGEVHTLKNLISRDETPNAGNSSQKASRHFSLLSPFRSKTSEKKVVT